jgi:DNA-binding transcriptional LysR family regulator
MDIHTRKLRYFLVVAEELHFSRAAARVFLTQQALSRQVKELEDELGVALFERTTRRVTLTPAGEAFREAVAPLVVGLDDALELTAPILAEFRAAFPDVDLDLREFPAHDPSAGLATGVTDVAFIRLPQGTADIETEALFVDPCVVAVAATHPLAKRDSLTPADIEAEPLTLSDTTDEVYRSWWSLQDTRSGPPPRIHPVSSVTEEIALVATGMAASVTSSAAATYTPMPGVRYLPLEGWPGSTVALGWHLGERSRIIAGFVDIVCAVRDREADLISQLESRGLDREDSHP